MTRQPLWLRRKWRHAAERAAQREPQDLPAAAPTEADDDQLPIGKEQEARPKRGPLADPDRKQGPEPPPGWRAGGSIYDQRF